MSVFYDDAHMEYYSFLIHANTIKISMTKYHHLLNRSSYGLFIYYS